jgi:hypothetical protein
MSNPNPNFVTPSTNRTSSEPSAETAPSTARASSNDDSALDNPIWVAALESNSNPVLCLEMFFASIHEDTTKPPERQATNPRVATVSTSTINGTVTPSTDAPPAKRRATSSNSIPQFAFKQTDRQKLSFAMEAVIWDDDEVRRQCKALALAADDTHALVSLEIDGKVFPTTCNRKALPGYLLSRLPQKAERNDNDSSWLKSVESVGKCKSSTNPQEELYCVVDSDSPFKGFVVDKKMLEFIGNGGVKHKRAVQPNGKRVCSFQFYQYNFHAGRKLSTSDVRHVDTTGHLTQGNPDCVYSLSQIAKSRVI